MLRHAAHPEREADVLVDRHVRVERIALKHHGDVAVAGVDIVHQLAVHDDVAFRRIFEAGDHPHRRGLAAARRAEKDDELLVGDVEVHLLDADHGAPALLDVLQFDTCHSCQPLTAPMVRPRLRVFLDRHHDEEDRQEGEKGDQRDGVVDHAVGATGEVRQRHRHRVGVRRRGDEQREEEFVDREDHRDDAGRDDARQDRRDDDLPQDAQVRRAVGARGVLKLLGDVQHVGPDDPGHEAEIDRGVDDHQRPDRVQKTGIAEQEEDRDRHDRRRHHAGRQDVEADIVAAAIGVARQRIGRRDRQHEIDHDRADDGKRPSCADTWPSASLPRSCARHRAKGREVDRLRRDDLDPRAQADGQEPEHRRQAEQRPGAEG